MSSPSLDRDEQQVRRRADPDAAEADFDAADEIQVLDEDRAPVERAVAVGVLEDQDAIAALAFGRAHGIGVRLGDPQPAAVVERERDRLDDVRLGRGERDGEARRQGHRLGRVGSRQARVRQRHPSAASC